MSYIVYILQNSTGKYYIGVTEDVANRLKQHNNGESKWTAKHRPWSLVWTSETFPTLSEALKLEKQLKRAKGGNSFYERTGLKRQ